MTPKDFTCKKVEIVKRHTGETLVPEDQIVYIPATKYMVDAMINYVKSYEGEYLIQTLDGDVCVYCAQYYNVEKNNCKGCPMHEAGNGCGVKGGSYDVCTDAIEGKEHAALTLEIVELAKEFIESNKGVFDEN